MGASDDFVSSDTNMFLFLKESHRTSPMGSHFYEVPRVIKPTGTRGTGEGEAVGVKVKDGTFGEGW